MVSSSQVLLPARHPGQGGGPAAGLPVQGHAQKHRDHRRREGGAAAALRPPRRSHRLGGRGVLRARAAAVVRRAAARRAVALQEAQHPAGRQPGQRAPRHGRQGGGGGRRRGHGLDDGGATEDSVPLGGAGRESAVAHGDHPDLQRAQDGAAGHAGAGGHDDVTGSEDLHRRRASADRDDRPHHAARQQLRREPRLATEGVCVCVCVASVHFSKHFKELLDS
ncbi:hypothetical protein EYF80_065964 [Liparis tanakae]|uniref:Uncharacterized protein n=1 Tax=Liparis tanakae TaxID=230148 RepID=A0A4Z2E565_9TELE|nr:hypothetical protein EYF80_065964 [Liparis tanakae]